MIYCVKLQFRIYRTCDQICFLMVNVYGPYSLLWSLITCTQRSAQIFHTLKDLSLEVVANSVLECRNTRSVTWSCMMWCVGRDCFVFMDTAVRLVPCIAYFIFSLLVIFFSLSSVLKVTDLVFRHFDTKLATNSKDKSLRVWNICVEHCVQVIRDHNSEIWYIDFDHEKTYLGIGAADLELRFYTINHDLHIAWLNAKKTKTDPTENKWKVPESVGEIQRQHNDKTATVRFNNNGKLLACQVDVEFYLLLCLASDRPILNIISSLKGD